MRLFVIDFIDKKYFLLAFFIVMFDWQTITSSNKLQLRKYLKVLSPPSIRIDWVFNFLNKEKFLVTVFL